LFEVIFIDTPTTVNIDSIKTIIQNHSNEIAAFIYEPLVQGAGGINIYEPKLLNEILNIAKLNDIICIADEVMTGFGRTGKLFASEYMHEKPDIICLSKGLTGGTMALGVTACSHKIYQAFVNDDKLKTFFHGHSFTANPLACSAAIASFDLLNKQDCLDKIQWISEQHIQFAIQLKKYEGKIKNIRTIGTIIAFEIVNGKDEYLNNISASITAAALEKGVYIRPLGNTVYIMPPYCITEAELRKVNKVIIEVIQ
jgi:adenosylmethionine-8-amino-7-oxononanoate aminotransferase